MNIDKLHEYNLSLEINNMNEEPFNFVYIYEYEDNRYHYEKKIYQPILLTLKENDLKTSFSYILESIYSQVNCIYINIKPRLDIKSLRIKSDIIGGRFELSTKEPITITNLVKEGSYNFTIKAEKFQNITFNVVMDNINIIPFEIVVFTEYNYRDIKGSNPIKTSEKKISFSSSKNQLISTFSYIVSKYWTHETTLKIIPNSNINYMNIKIELENIYYDFYSEIKTIYNLTIGNKYYLDKRTYGQGKVYLDLMMDYKDNNPFESIKVYEYEWSFEYDNKSESIINYADIKTKKRDGLLNIYSTYEKTEEFTSGVVFELTPNYNISYLKVTYYENYIKVDTSMLYIYIIIAVVIVLIIIVVIYIIKRYKSKARKLYYSSLVQPQSLAPVETQSF